MRYSPMESEVVFFMWPEAHYHPRLAGSKADVMNCLKRHNTVQIRNPTSEGRKKTERRNPNGVVIGSVVSGSDFGSRISAFLRPSCLGLRISPFTPFSSSSPPTNPLRPGLPGL